MGEMQETTETRRISWMLTMLGRLPHDHAVRMTLFPVVCEMIRTRRRVVSALTLSQPSRD
jgi:hypothetical protein